MLLKFDKLSEEVEVVRMVCKCRGYLESTDEGDPKGIEWSLRSRRGRRDELIQTNLRGMCA